MLLREIDSDGLCIVSVSKVAGTETRNLFYIGYILYILIKSHFTDIQIFRGSIVFSCDDR